MKPAVFLDTANEEYCCFVNPFETIFVILSWLSRDAVHNMWASYFQPLLATNKAQPRCKIKLQVYFLNKTHDMWWVILRISRENLCLNVDFFWRYKLGNTNNNKCLIWVSWCAEVKSYQDSNPWHWTKLFQHSEGCSLCRCTSHHQTRPPALSLTLGPAAHFQVESTPTVQTDVWTLQSSAALQICFCWSRCWSHRISWAW